MDPRRIATFTGWLWIATFVTSIPARFIFYAPVLDEPNYVTGGGADAWALVATGAVLELFLIISNVGTAVVPFPILKRQSEIGLSATSRPASSSASSSRSGSSACSRS
jgi:hypothetical protein